MKYIGMTYPDINNGIGLRVTLWLSGCSHHCKSCHNPETWIYENGKDFLEKDWNKLSNILEKEYINGITLSGGDPLYEDNVTGLKNLVLKIKKQFPNKSIWLYTGYEWEYITKCNSSSAKKKKEIIEFCDVVIDGEFKEELRDITLPWRGSSNQKVIDVKKTLKTGKIVELIK